MTTHELKCWARYFDAIEDGHKTFELRKNDRCYQTGDVLVLTRCDEEWPYTPRAKDGFARAHGNADVTLRKRVTYIMHGSAFGLADGWVCMSLAAATQEGTEP